MFLFSVPEWMGQNVEFWVFPFLVSEWIDRNVMFGMFFIAERNIEF